MWWRKSEIIVMENHISIVVWREKLHGKNSHSKDITP
jgi:hypothetical protein